MSATFGFADIEALVQAGNGYAAEVLGTPCDIHRPAALSAPGPVVVTLPVFLTTDEKSATIRANKYGAPLWYGRFDRTLTQVGDYLIGPPGTFFIAAQQSLLTTLLVECNATVSFARPTGDTEPAAEIDTADYGARSDATDAPLFGEWPASVLIKSRGEASQTGLPGDGKQALFEVLLPATAGVTLRTSDLMTDDTGRRFVLDAIERTDLGFRLYAQLTAS